ncbi:ImmA/IrrE family metallo-endopeptidase [Clostridium butyricum]|uniref:ImmA/IrrE family metallo-endopeptidase n=1 Tax=Clostridium butyricum TaxID=1492 RepID=UPI0013CFB690|nr:ImmA/IrrE family metallo-endopeptidase [Clostridium butyricum]MCQ2017279.1 ImmA/IrrE family metallo-endopeptidase [Clostridium butyricum]MCQ2021152.1 ImmA/IrrE family metallo-endopeptidase [Clostridium butyricum]NFB72508.1 ImmA/IrrE family metallo-endopeptidase [Clostridium butyricum]NFB91567.1 ImmA/IrrE family metallo-endopeptidase [Clostridium butyricum]UTY53583.1 ImmA/IrrE family metallo-endopeptidase [Clostridium butyricum]
MKELVEKWQKILRIEDWDIQVIEARDFENDGESYIIYNFNRARITVKKELSKEEKEKTIVHELLHIIHRDECDIAQDNLEGYTETTYTRFHERNIEKIAQILYALNNV